MKVLTFSAVVEAGTGLVLVLDPAIAARLLLGAELSETGVVVGRCFGIALLGLSAACLPERQGGGGGSGGSRPASGMLLYNLFIALYLGYLGTAGHYSGIMLWPAVVLHAVVTVLLFRTWKAVSAER